MTRNKPLRTADYLGHIAEAIDNIQSYTAGMDAAEFKADAKRAGARLLHGGPGHRVGDGECGFARAEGAVGIPVHVMHQSPPQRLPVRGRYSFCKIYGAKAELEKLLGRGVDLVEPGAVRNPYVLASINRHREPVYAA